MAHPCGRISFSFRRIFMISENAHNMLTKQVIKHNVQIHPKVVFYTHTHTHTHTHWLIGYHIVINRIIGNAYFSAFSKFCIINVSNLNNQKTKGLKSPQLVWLSGLNSGLWTKGSLVQFLVRAHAWVACQVPGRGRMRGNHTLMFLLSFSVPSPLSKNK